MSVPDAIKRSFVSGLLLLAPLVITLYVLQVAFTWLLKVVNPVVRGTRLTQYTANIDLVAQLVAAALIVVAVTALGYAAQRRSGQRVFGWFGRAVTFVPLVNTVYSSVRQVSNAFVSRRTSYESVVLVEHPRLGVYSVGLVTSESPSPVATIADERVYNVFLPNSPNPTAGRLVLVPEGQLEEIDMSIRRGLRLLVTTGMSEEEAANPQL